MSERSISTWEIPLDGRKQLESISVLGRKMLLGSVRELRRQIFQLKATGRVDLGSDVVLGPSCRIAPGIYIRIGNRVNVGADFTCHVNLTIGDDVMISSQVAFIGNDHAFDDPSKNIHTQGLLPPSSALLQGDNLIGYGTTILGDVTIGRGAIVGAGSLVTTDLPPYTVCFGRPAKPIRKRFEDDQK